MEPIALSSPSFPTNRDIVRLIFSRLTTEDLLRCALVCKKWHQNVRRVDLIPVDISPAVLEDFKSLLVQNVIRNLELSQFSKISSFLTRISVQELNQNDRLIKQHNPNLSARHVTCEMPQTFAQMGNYRFTVCDLYKIRVEHEGKTYQLEEPSQRQLAFIAVEKQFIFGLTNTGHLIQWDFLKGHVVAEFDTAYSTGHDSLTDLINDTSQWHTHRCFLVQNGYVVIKYGFAMTRVLELIPYQNLKAREVIILPWDCYPKQMVIRDQRLYILNRGYVVTIRLTPDKIDRFESIQIDIDNTYFLWDMSIQKNILFCNGCNNMFYMVDLRTKKEIGRFKISGNSSIMVMDNLIIGFYSPYGESKIQLYDINTEKLLTTIPFDNNALSSLIDLIRKHRKKLVLEPTTSNCVLV